MADGVAEQLTLFADRFRCDDCGGLVERLRKTRRFRLCDACYERVVPVFAPDERIQAGSPEWEANRRYWEWYDEMEQRVPRRVEPGHAARARKPAAPQRTPDELYPLCDCGRPREVNTIGRMMGRGGLFGGPFHRECAVCEARGQVEGVVDFMSGIHPEWDDEDWLDHLWRVFPKAFEVGVLPDYWYELRRRLPVKGGVATEVKRD